MKSSFVIGLCLFGSSLLADPVKTHPRLMFRAEDLPALRARMTGSNDAWVAFNTQVAEPCLRDWRCSATHHYAGAPSYEWVRDSFTDENGVLHLPSDADWSSYANARERPAVPEDDVGDPTGHVRLASESYAMLFALMARLYKDDPAHAALRADYLAAAKECLFTVINQAHLGTAALPWRWSNFAQNDRSFGAEAFPLCVDWIYEDFTPVELAKIRKAFLVWAEQTNDHVYFAPTMTNGQHGPANSPELFRFFDPLQLERRSEIRLALNNHWGNHLRQLALYSLALDPQHDVPVTPGTPADGVVADSAVSGSLTSQLDVSGNWVPQDYGVLRDVTGVWLYLTDYAYRHDGLGSLSVEGTQYASNGLGPVALAMLCLQTSGQDNAQVWGPQTSLVRHPFWSKTMPAYLSQLTPTPRVVASGDYNYLGPIFQPPLSGDLETFAYINDQFIKVLGPMGIASARMSGTNASAAQAARYIQRNLSQGGPSNFAYRISNTRANGNLRDAIYYFLLFDPTATTASDPRPALQPKTFVASHRINGHDMGMFLARSGYSSADTYFHWRLDWNQIDHQRGDSLSFGLWKNGLWLTKVMAGYGALQGCSDYRNALAIQTGTPTSSGTSEDTLAVHGSQWIYSPAGDPHIVARSTAGGFLHFTGDATNLYNHRWQSTLQECAHASRSLVWLKPGRIVVYDRAKTKQAGFFKRFWLNLPELPADVDVTGNIVHSTAYEGATAKAELFVTKLLPLESSPQITDISSGEPSAGEDMHSRVFTESTTQDARFLHVIEGTDAGGSAVSASNLASNDGEFEGCFVGDTALMFRKTLGSAASGLSYSHAAFVTRHYITGLAPFAGYSVTQTSTNVTVTSGGARFTDGGGVLVLGTAEPASVEISATDDSGSESGDAIVFTFKRSGDVSGALTASIGINTELSSASASDISSVPVSVTFAAGSAVTVLTLTPTDDSDYEGTETLVLTLLDGSGYHVSEAANEASATINDNDSPPGGVLAFAAASYTATEGAGASAMITLTRTGGASGGVSVRLNTNNGTALAGSDYTATNAMVSWADGDSATKQVLIPLINDNAIEPDETVNLSLSQITGQAGLGLASAVLTIADDEPPQFALSPASISVTEDTPSVTFDVTRSGGSNSTVSINYATANGSATAPADYLAVSGTLNWAPGDAATKQVTVLLNDDTLYEGTSEFFAFTLSSPSNGGSITTSATTTVKINENDPPPAAFHAGPGQTYATLASVPWGVVGAGSEVFIHYDPAGYHAKLLIAARGIATQPIRITGLAGPNGERPILDGDNASPPPLSAPYDSETSGASESSGLIVIERASGMNSNFKPGYIEISGLELRNAHPDYNFTRQSDGSTSGWSSNGGAIFLRGAEHVTVRDCVIHHCANGLITNDGGGEERNLVRDLLVSHCWFHDQGKPGNYYGRNIETKAVGFMLQFCKLDAPLSGANVSNVRDYSAGFVGRCNYVTGGASQFEFPEPYNEIPLISGDAGYATAHLWGNVIRNFGGGSYTCISFDGITSAGARTLHFHHNTVHCQNDYQRVVLYPNKADKSVLATNNLFYKASITEFYLNGGAGTVSFGKNLATTGFYTSTGASGASNIVSASTMGFVDQANGDYHLAAGSAALNAGAALPVGAMPLFAQYAPHALGVLRTRVGAADDLGAFELGQPIDAWRLSHFSLNAADASIAADEVDFDGDGAANLLEHALGTNPTAINTSWMPDVTRTDGKLVMTVNKNPAATDVTFTVEVSDDLLTWHSGAPYTTTLQNTSSALQVRDDSTAERQFIRLRVTR